MKIEEVELTKEEKDIAQFTGEDLEQKRKEKLKQLKNKKLKELNEKYGVVEKKERKKIVVETNKENNPIDNQKRLWEKLNGVKVNG